MSPWPAPRPPWSGPSRAPPSSPSPSSSSSQRSPDAARIGIPSAASPWAKTWVSLSDSPSSSTSISQMKVCEEKPRGLGVLAWCPISTTASSVAAGGLGEGRLGLVQGEVGDRPHLDPRRHPLAFDVGADHVPVADGDPLDARRRAAPRSRAPRRSSAAGRGRRRRDARAGTRRSPRFPRSPPCPRRSGRSRRAAPLRRQLGVDRLAEGLQRPVPNPQLGRRVGVHVEAGELLGRGAARVAQLPGRRRPGRGSRRRPPPRGRTSRAVTSERLKSAGVSRWRASSTT